MQRLEWSSFFWPGRVHLLILASLAGIRTVRQAAFSTTTRIARSMDRKGTMIGDHPTSPTLNPNGGSGRRWTGSATICPSKPFASFSTRRDFLGSDGSFYSTVIDVFMVQSQGATPGKDKLQRLHQALGDR